MIIKKPVVKLLYTARFSNTFLPIVKYRCLLLWLQTLGRWSRSYGLIKNGPFLHFLRCTTTETNDLGLYVSFCIVACNGVF